MKKFYALAVAVFSLMSMSAATPRTLDLSSLGEPIPVDQLPAQLRNAIGQPVKALNPLQHEAMKKAPAKAAAIESLLGEYDCTYTDLLEEDDATVNTNVTFYYSEDYDDYELNIPENNIIDFCFEFDEATGSAVFKQINFGKDGNYYVFQIPLKGTSTTSSATLTYNESTNTFDFEEGTGLGLAAVNSQGSIAGWYFAGTFSEIGTPEFDYSIKVTASEECNASNVFDFTITAGADVAGIKYIANSGDLSASQLKQYFALLGDDIEAGTYSLDFASAPATGPYSFLVASYDADGNIQKTSQAVVIVTVDEDDLWQTVTDKYEYNDQILSQIYKNVSHSQTVTLQESIDNPGVYRLVSPYSEFARNHADDHNHYLYITATDPEFVNIEYSPTGTDLGYGHLVVGTFGGAMGYSKEQCQAYQYPVGSLSGRVITFPERSILSHESGYNDPGSWSYGNTSAEVVITLPAITIDVTVVNENGEPVEGVELSFVTDDTEVVTPDADEEPADTPAAYLTDADGKVQLTAADDVAYFGNVSLLAAKNDVSQKADVKLNGAENSVAITIDDPITTAIGNVISGSDNTPVQYFNLQGQRIDNPAKGQIVISRRGNTATKIIVK